MKKPFSRTTRRGAVEKMTGVDDSKRRAIVTSYSKKTDPRRDPGAVPN